MQIKMIDINSIKPYKGNPRKNDAAIKYIERSIKDFGFKVPLVIDKNSVIVCGHTRYKAALSLKMTELPCIIADDLTPEQIKAFRIADNKAASISEWDNELLMSEIQSLLSDGVDIKTTGFSLEEIGIGNVELNKSTGDDKKDIKTNKLRFGKTSVVITDEELDLLNKKYALYVSTYGSPFGFASSLVGE